MQILANVHWTLSPFLVLSCGGPSTSVLSKAAKTAALQSATGAGGSFYSILHSRSLADFQSGAYRVIQ